MTIPLALTRAQEDALLLEYADGNADLVTETRLNIRPKDITAWAEATLMLLKPEAIQRFQSSMLSTKKPNRTAQEDALLLKYADGNADLVAKTRRNIRPEDITAWCQYVLS